MQEVFPTEAMTLRSLPEDLLKMTDTVSRRLLISCCLAGIPNETELQSFTRLLANQRSLPTNFVRDVIMKAPSKDIMNALSRSVLTLYCYDKEPDDISLPNVLRQCLNLISVFPLLSVYGYQAYTIMYAARAFTFTIRRRSFPQQRIFCVCSVLTKSIPTWRRRSWILP